jgi:hypothetical protein
MTNPTRQDLIKEAFNQLNSYKRHRAKTGIARKEKNEDKAQYHELRQYRAIDELELALRAIQREHFTK